MMKKTVLLTCAGLIMLVGVAQAGTWTWETGADATAIVDEQYLVQAGNLGLNAQTAQIEFLEYQPNPDNVNSASASGGPVDNLGVYTGTDPDMDALMNTAYSTYGGDWPRNTNFNFSDLVVGHDYRFQALVYVHGGEADVDLYTGNWANYQWNAYNGVSLATYEWNAEATNVSIFVAANGDGTVGYADTMCFTLHDLDQPAAHKNTASNPSPADTADHTNPDADLSWDGPAIVADPAYDVYFGTSATPPQVATTQTATSYEPGTMSYMTTYYWRVDVFDDPNTYTGTLWSFTTGGKATDPSPPHGYQHAATPEMDVSWAGDDWATSFKVYSGTSKPYTMLGEVTESHYEGVPTPAENTTYWWAVDEYVGTTKLLTGDDWSMTTGGPYANWALDETNVGDPNFVIADSVNGYNGLALDANTVADGVFDRALQLDGQITSHAEIPPMNINSDRVTIMAWVKPDGPQAAWAGIVMSREPNTVAGINIGDGGGLRYHWDGAGESWEFNPGLNVAVDCWSHVALTTEPTKATLYCNAYAAENPTTIPVQEFDGTTMIGRDDQNVRDYKGLIDDVWIYDRPLTANEIATYYETSDFAKYPDPANGETEVDLEKVLSWTAGAGATAHNVYFGSVSPATTQVLSNTTVTTYDPDPALEVDTWYYWRVDEVTAGGTVTGCEWSFKSAPPRAYNPSPADDATGVDPNVVLSWTPGQGGTYNHDVYFGTSETAMDWVSTEQTATTYDPYGSTNLDWAATYYWRIDERNASDGSLAAVGDVWSFTTIVPTCTEDITGDINDDCVVDLKDLAAMVDTWLDCNLDPAEACPY